MLNEEMALHLVCKKIAMKQLSELSEDVQCSIKPDVTRGSALRSHFFHSFIFVQNVHILGVVFVIVFLLLQYQRRK